MIFGSDGREDGYFNPIRHKVWLSQDFSGFLNILKISLINISFFLVIFDLCHIFVFYIRQSKPVTMLPNSKNMKKLLVLFLSFVSLSLSAIQTKYVLFDPHCMDRLEYRYAGGSTDYVTYQVRTASGIIALEVGVENVKDYSRIPQGAIGCGHSLFDENLVKSINNRLMDVYVVMPLANGHYRISPARMAGYMSNDPNSGKIIRPDYECAYSDKDLNSGGNLATTQSESQVFYSGEVASKCTPYHFTSISKNTCRPNTELYYLHGVGIVEERVGATIEEENKNKYVLRTINGVSLDEFKKAYCKGIRIELGTSPKKAALTKPAETPAEVFVPKRCQGTAKPNHHLVQYGESLFGIARQEGVTVRQLRKWNHLKSSKILACSQLRVRAPRYASAKSVKKAPKKYVPKKQFKAKGIAAKKQVSQPKALPAKKYVSKVHPKKSTTGVHIVGKGENLYMLATLYGYTVDRFAHMNGLEKDAILQPGMELFTTDCSCPTTTPEEAKPAPKKAVSLETIEIDDEKEMPVLSSSSKLPSERVVAAPKVTYHIVNEGETIWSIANSYGFDTSELMKRNNLEAGEVLIPGQKIYFPK